MTKRFALFRTGFSLAIATLFLVGNLGLHRAEAKANNKHGANPAARINSAGKTNSTRSGNRLTLHQLENAVYRLPPEIGDESDQLIKLTNGSYKDGDFTVQLETVAFGDLDKDGKPDAATVFYWNGGGSGYFERLEVFLNKGGKPVALEPKVIGDRVGIKGLSIKSGTIILNVLSHGTLDGACCPTVKRTAQYRVVKGELVGPDSLYE